MTDKKFAQIMVGLLSLQFVLGILANLYTTIPSSKPYEVFNKFNFIAFHAINGMLLLVLASVFLARAVKGKRLIREAAQGLSSIVLAFIFGELFVFTQKDIFSFLMALSFLGALFAYARITFSGPLPEEPSKAPRVPRKK
jgi:hypothetical protein